MPCQSKTSEEIQPCTVNPVFSGHSKRRPKLAFNSDFHLMQVKSIAECSPWSILQYFRPSLSYYLSIKFLFCLFLSGRLRQVLLYVENVENLNKDTLKRLEVHCLLFKMIRALNVFVQTEKLHVN